MITASSRKGKLPRLTEMLWTVWKHRKWAEVVLIDTYSTWNFWYAWSVARLCGWLGLFLHRPWNYPPRWVRRQSRGVAKSPAQIGV